MTYFPCRICCPLSQKHDGMNSLHLAALNGHRDCVQFLIEEGADVSVTTNNRQTPVLLAALR